MKKLLVATLIIAYAVVEGIGASYLGPVRSPLFITALSVIFVLVFMRLVQNHFWLAYAAITLCTIIFPITVLIFIGWESHPSFGEQVALMLSTFIKHGNFLGLEWFFPLLGSAFGAFAVQRIWPLTLRSKSLPPVAGRPESGPPVT